MAAVVQNARPVTNVNGSQREMYFNTITITTSGDTLFVPFRTINEMDINTTSVSLMAATATAGGNNVTFTTTGTVSNALFKVTGQ